MSRIAKKAHAVMIVIAIVNLIMYIDWNLVEVSLGPLPILIITGLLITIGLLAMILLVVKIIEDCFLARRKGKY